MKKETFYSRANRLFSRNSHQGFRRFFGLLHRGVGLQNPRRHWRKRIFLGKLALDSRYHGIWGSGATTWETFKPMLEAKGFDRVSAVTYKNDESFTTPATLQEVVDGKGGITLALDGLRKAKIAGHKVDVVVHSMGGFVVRALCAKAQNFCKETIRKLITLDMPYYGSELADWLWLHENGRNFFYETEPVKGRVSEDEQLSCDQYIQLFIGGGDTRVYSLKQHIPRHRMGGAVDSLKRGRVPRVPPGEWLTLSSFSNEVPTHAIVGSLAPNIGGSFLPITISPEMWWLENYLLDTCGLSFYDVFPDDGDDIPDVNASDGVVAVGSQRDGILVGSEQTTHIVGVDHLNVTDSEGVVEAVGGLLEGDMRRFTVPGP